VLGIEMRPVRGHPGASLGAAVIAAIGIGALDDWSDVTRFIALDAPVVPDRTRTSTYDDAYRAWRELGDAVAPISHAMARSTR
jgi:xylulokinase